MKKKKIQLPKLTSQDLQRAIARLLRDTPTKQYTSRQIIEKLGISNNKDSVKYALEQLAARGAAPVQKTELKPRLAAKYAKAERSMLTGTVDLTRKGDAFITQGRRGDGDIFVGSRNLNGALHNDTVEVEVETRPGHRPEGRVMRVITRAADHFIGTLYMHKSHAIVAPDRTDVWDDIYVATEDIKGATHGDHVVVKITTWPSKAVRMPIGVVTTVLGKTGGHNYEMQSVLINHGFNIEFPEEVLAEAEKFSGKITKRDEAARRDMRGITTFTIDPIDAKDFDDALSIRYLEDDTIEVGVHIADVTHFLKPGTALDKEAYLRSTSVYLVDRVCPMLPERLSNELCSLRPNEDKFTFSAVFVMNKQGTIQERWFGKTLIHSDRRFSYEEAQEILDAKKGDFAEDLLELNRLAHILRKKKLKKGAIAFEDAEVRFRLSEQGEPIEVYVKDRKDAHMLIEDFMLLANREVATYIHNKANGVEIPFVYRIHDSPDMGRLEDFARFAAELGQKLDLQTPKKIAESFNKMTAEAANNPTLKLLMPLAIRTMAKAIYSTDNIGHYGLAFDFYSHFTSPIRRYADVLAHRVLFDNLKKVTRVDKATLEEQCQHISKQEKKAAESERESTKYFQTVFLENRVGDTFEGIISGMIERGIFVELTGSRAEGFIAFDRIRSDSYQIDTARMRATGRRTGRVLRMGEPVRVRVMMVDTAERKIELALIEK